MNRWLMIGSMVGLLVTATGCLHHNTRGGCNSCSSGHHSAVRHGSSRCAGGACGGDCGGACQKREGMLSRIGGRLRGNQCAGNCGGACGAAHGGGGRAGCVAGPLGWQQGGLDYSSDLQPGLTGHRAARQLQNQPFRPGPPSAQVGYPYYTHRGPRDFFLDDPPTIGR